MSSSAVERRRASIDYDLGSADEEVRRLAVERISDFDEVDALPRVADCLGDVSWRVRKAAVLRILELRDCAAVDALLIESLADGENSGRRNAAAETLVRRGVAALPAVHEALGAPDSDVRKQLVDVVAGIADESAEPAMRSLLGDPDPNVAAAAADALGVIGSEHSAVALRAVVTMAELDRLLRMSALRALVRLDVAVEVAALEPLLDDRVLRPAALTALSASDDPHATDLLLKNMMLRARSSRDAAIAGLIRVLGRRDQADAASLVMRIREAAAAEAGWLDGVIGSLDSGDLSTRMNLLQFLGIVGEARAAVPILRVCREEALAELARGTLEALGDAGEVELDEAWEGLDVLLRIEVCRTLGHTAGATGSLRLRDALADSDAGLRTVAIESLGRRADLEAIPALAGRLESVSLAPASDAVDEMRALVDALVAIASAADGDLERVGSVVEQMTDRLASSSDPTRIAVARVLGRIGRPGDAEHVTRLMRDANADVRREAVVALGRLAGEVGCDPLRLALADESVAVRCAAAGALARCGEVEIFDDLVRLRGDGDARVQAAALRAMAEHGTRHAASHLAALDQMAATTSDEPRALLAAAESLSQLGGSAAARIAVGFLQSREPEVIHAAVSCIGECGDEEDLAALMDLVAHPDWTVRAEAIQTLSRRSCVRAVPVILRRLETELDGFVRDAILSALARLDG